MTEITPPAWVEVGDTYTEVHVMSEKQRAPDGILCSAECPLLQQGHCLEAGISCPDEYIGTAVCAPELDDLKSAYAKKRVQAKADVATVAPQTREEIQFVQGEITDGGLELFAVEINGLIAAGWRRLGRPEVVPCTLGHVLLQPMVRDVPLDVDDCEE